MVGFTYVLEPVNPNSSYATARRGPHTIGEGIVPTFRRVVKQVQTMHNALLFQYYDRATQGGVLVKRTSNNLRQEVTELFHETIGPNTIIYYSRKCGRTDCRCCTVTYAGVRPVGVQLSGVTHPIRIVVNVCEHSDCITQCLHGGGGFTNLTLPDVPNQIDGNERLMDKLRQAPYADNFVRARVKFFLEIGNEEVIAPRELQNDEKDMIMTQMVESINMEPGETLVVFIKLCPTKVKQN